MAQLALKALRKRFDGIEAVCGIDLTVAHEEFVVLVGPSGCGKSTILRMIAGLEEASSGEIRIDARAVVRHGDRDAVRRCMRLDTHADARARMA